MRKIAVRVLNESNESPASFMMFLAKLTQRGHNVKDMTSLLELYNDCMDNKFKTASEVAALPHGTIKRFTPITIAIVGASRRFLAQARTHQVGFNYVSASLQYSDYTDQADFVVPYELLEKDAEAAKSGNMLGDYSLAALYTESCNAAMSTYKLLASKAGNDAAGYAAPQGLRNVLIIQANHEAWMTFINKRACNRNTLETQYVALKIWEELLKTTDGAEMFRYAGPDCINGMCREGKFFCGTMLGPSIGPSQIIKERFPLL